MGRTWCPRLKGRHPWFAQARGRADDLGAAGHGGFTLGGSKRGFDRVLVIALPGLREGLTRDLALRADIDLTPRAARE